jgi:hypothetical protein
MITGILAIAELKKISMRNASPIAGARAAAAAGIISFLCPGMAVFYARCPYAAELAAARKSNLTEERSS